MGPLVHAGRLITGVGYTNMLSRMMCDALHETDTGDV